MRRPFWSAHQDAWGVCAITRCAGVGLEVSDILGFLAADKRSGRSAISAPETTRRTASALHADQCRRRRWSEFARCWRAFAALEVLQLPDQPRCCGAAGNYFIEQPGRADRLRDEKLDQVALQSPDCLLTTNIGCRIFLGNGLRQRDSTVPVLHPLTLLAHQLEIVKCPDRLTGSIACSSKSNARWARRWIRAGSESAVALDGCCRWRTRRQCSAVMPAA